MQPMKNMKKTLPVLVAALLSSVASAETKFGDHVTLTGFGTMGAAVTDTDEAQFRTALQQARGADKTADFGVDSRLGLQANAKFNDIFSMTGQVLVSRRIAKSASLEWLYGEAKLPAGFTAKLGRMVLPTFMISDSRSVGYAAHWLRAPQEVYLVYPASSFDGGQVTYQQGLGPVTLTAQLSAGKAKSTISVFGAQGQVELDGIRSVNVQFETGPWQARLGYTTADAETRGLPLPLLTDKFTGAGLQYDDGRAIVLTEFVTRRQDSVMGGPLDSDSWYLSAGWRFGKFTPYGTHSRLKPKGFAYGTTVSDKSTALGLRWDAMSNVAVKAQVQKSESGALSFVNASPAFAAGRPSVQVVSLAVDFVF